MKTMMKHFLFAVSLLVVIAGANITASAQQREGAGAISGTIRWPKVYGRPNAEPPFAALVITAYAPTGRVYGTGRHLSFADADGYYECRYNIPSLPEGVPILVSVSLARGYKWVGGGSLLVSYRREFTPDGWTGEATLMRPSADIPGRARGDFTVSLVGHGASNKIHFLRPIR
jgi:hypothetical protein